MTTEHEAPTENYDDENPVRDLECLHIREGEAVHFTGPATIWFRTDRGKMWLFARAVASTDVWVRTAEGRQRKLAMVDTRKAQT